MHECLVFFHPKVFHPKVFKADFNQIWPMFKFLVFFQGHQTGTDIEYIPAPQAKILKCVMTSNTKTY